MLVSILPTILENKLERKMFWKPSKTGRQKRRSTLLFGPILKATFRKRANPGSLSQLRPHFVTFRPSTVKERQRRPSTYGAHLHLSKHHFAWRCNRSHGFKNTANNTIHRTGFTRRRCALPLQTGR